MLQHYVFYANAEFSNEREPLLADYEQQENEDSDQQSNVESENV